MVRRVKIPHPDGNSREWANPRFYVAQYDPIRRDYVGLCVSDAANYRRYLRHAIVDAEVLTAAGEQVHCIYELNGLSWKRHEWSRADAERSPEWGQW